MKISELAGRIQLAGLPEAEYRFVHPQLGELPMAYPEVKLGLLFQTKNGVSERRQDEWLVVMTSEKTVDLKEALERIGRLYEQQLNLAPPELLTIRTASPASSEGASAAADIQVFSSLPSASGDLEEVLIHYLGTMWLRALQSAEGSTGTWVRHRGDQDPLIQSLDRARRLLIERHP